MKVTKEKVEDCQAFLTVELDEADMESAMEDAYKRLAKKANIPGFRKGKAPRQITEHYLGHGTILEEAIDRMLPQAYEQALTEQEIEPYAQPSVSITNMEPLAFTATVPLVPSVELGDYKDIRLEPLKIEIGDENINNVIEELRHQNASWEPADREVNFDDLASMDILGEVEEKPWIRKVGAQVQVMKDSVSPAPGFFEEVVGMKKDEEKEFTLTFPENYPSKEVAGKECHFKVKLHEVKEEKLPEVGDELATLVSADFKTLDDLKEEIVKSLNMRAEENIRMDLEERSINAAIDQAKIEYPPVVVEYEVDRIIQEQERQLGGAGRNLEDYLANIGKTAEQLREDLRPVARKNVSASLVMGKIAEVEDIKTTDEDIDNGINNMCKNVPEDQIEAFKQMLNTEQTRASLSTQLKTRKVIEFLTDIAKTEDDKPKTVEKTADEEPPASQDSATETKEETNEPEQ